MYDENFDHKYDLLGRLKIPLLRITNNRKRWYALKGRHLRTRAHGKDPKILLEMFFTYNLGSAWLKIIKSPRQEVYYPEHPSKQVNAPMHSVNRIQAVTSKYVDTERLLGAFNMAKEVREERGTSYTGLQIAMLFLIYFFEPWMMPMALAMPFVYNILVPQNDVTNNCAFKSEDVVDDDEEDAEEVGQDEIDDAVKRVPWLTSINDKMRQIQEMKFSVQLGLEMLANELESIQNLYNFSVPLLSWIAFGSLGLLTVILKYISIRHLIMALVMKKIVTSLVGGRSMGAIDLISFMSRVPDNEELEDYRELCVSVDPQDGQNDDYHDAEEDPANNDANEQICDEAATNKNDKLKSEKKSISTKDDSPNNDAMNKEKKEHKRIRTSMEGMRGLMSALAQIQNVEQ